MLTRRRATTPGPTPAASGAPTRTRCSPAPRCSWSPTGWAGRRPARSPRGSPSRPSSRASPTAAEPERELAELARAANERIHELSHSNAEQAGMGTTLTALYVGEQRGRHRPRRRQPRLLPARRQAAAADRRPHARRRADAPGQADPRGSRRAPPALGHHPRARPRRRRRGRHPLLPGPRRGRLPAVQRRSHDDGLRGGDRRRPAHPPATCETRARR